MDRRLMNTTYLQGRIQDLHRLHNQNLSDYSQLVQSLTQECDIYCELIPAYKISAKLESASETGHKQKKEVYNIERLEHELLTQYEHFLQLLRKLQRKSHPEQQALGSRMTAKLISESSAAEFNHAETLLTLGVRFANAKSIRVAKPSMDAIQKLLDGRTIDDCTDCVVHAILAIVRQQHHALNPKILNMLLFIRVAMIDPHRRDITEEKEKQKRLKNKDKELARQMQKAEARRSRAELSAKQIKVIHSVFVIYLRVLQASQSCSREHQAKILAPALEGLAKFAPLVNVEHYQLLMKALRELVDEEDTVVTTKLHALVAVACLAQKDVMLDASEWRVDLTHFHEVLYRCVGAAMSPPQVHDITGKKEEEESAENDDTASRGSTSTAGSLSSVAFSIAQSMAAHRQTQQSLEKEWGYRCGLCIRAIDLLVLSQKFVPTTRVIALCRRLFLLASAAPPNITIATISLVHRLLLRYPAAASTFIGGSDNYLAGKGNFDPEAEEMNASNSDCSFAWEVALLHRSYHPTVREVAAAFARHYHKVSKNAMGSAPIVTRQLDMLGPYEVLEKYDASMGDVQPPPMHPDKRSRGKKGPANVTGADAAQAKPKAGDKRPRGKDAARAVRDEPSDDDDDAQDDA